MLRHEVSQEARETATDSRGGFTLELQNIRVGRAVDAIDDAPGLMVRRSPADF
jgi:hypothetical protein